jgi:hypothetical protein
VKDAPNVDLDGRHLARARSSVSTSYYGLSTSGTAGYTDTGRTDTGTDTARTDTGRTDTDTTAAGYADTTRTTTRPRHHVRHRGADTSDRRPMTR